MEFEVRALAGCMNHTGGRVDLQLRHALAKRHGFAPTMSYVTGCPGLGIKSFAQVGKVGNFTSFKWNISICHKL
jgi:hypothetical protein